MAKFFAQIRFIAGALALAFIVATAVPATPASAQNAPTAATSEQQLLQQFKMIQGRGTIPDVKSYVLEHPAGRDWRTFHTVTLKWIGAIAIIGMLALLAIFFMWRGTMEIEGGRSGRTILRFNAFERFVHWLTAVTFIVLGITGLNITFGRSLLLPWMGPQTFSDLVGMGEVFAQLSQLRLHHRCCADVPDLDRTESADRDRRRLVQGWRRHVWQGKRCRRRTSSTAAKSRIYWMVVLGGAAMIISAATC